MSEDELRPQKVVPEAGEVQPGLSDEELEARAEDLMARARVSHKLPEVPDWDYKRPKESKNPLDPVSDGGSTRGLGVGLSMAYVMLGSVILGFGAGWLLDNATHQQMLWKPILGFGGTILGLVSTLIMLSREGNRPQ